MEIVKQQSFYVDGASVETTGDKAINPKTSPMPDMWKSFGASGKGHEQGVFAVYQYTGGEVPDNPSFKFTLGIPAEKGLKIPAQDYMVFKFDAVEPSWIYEAWHEVRRYFDTCTDYARTFNVDYEQYTEQGAKLFVGVRKV